MTRIVFYYDCVSPWARMAYEVLKRYEKAWQFELVLKPHFLGGVMVASGNKPPVTVANKGKWMNAVDMPLASEYYRIPFVFPDTFPVNTMQMIRFLRQVEDKAPNKLRSVTDIFFDVVWAGKTSSAKASAMPDAWREVISRDLFNDQELEQFIKDCQGTENKDRVKREAGELVEEGAFGFPWIVAERDDGEKRPFFGADRFEVMAYWLGKKWNGPFPEGSDSASAKM